MNLMQSNDSGLNGNNQIDQNNTSGQQQQNDNNGGNSPQPGSGHLQMGHGSHQVVQLNKKIIGTRKRNNRDKSYDSYNQKLQLPPMIKTPQDRSDRTYSVPTTGVSGSGANSAAANNLGSNSGHHHN
jgi:hypothetical protein